MGSAISFDLKKNFPATVTDDRPFKYQIDGRPMRVLFCSADSYGCGFYRCFMPSYFLQACHLAESRIDGKGGAVGFEHIDWSDIIVFQRLRSPINTAFIYATKQGKRIVIENDDWYAKVPPGSHAKQFFPAAVLKGINYTISVADGQTVTTEVLEREYEKITKPVKVISNGMDPSHVDHDYPSDNNKIVIGYQGSITHTVDFMEAEAALIDVLSRYPNVHVHAMGFLPDQVRQQFQSRVYLHPWVPLHEYYATLRGLRAHFMIAPIANLPFNLAKSSLKIVEYGFLKTPWIASKVGPYIDVTQKSGGGLLVKNRFKDWTKALEKMINMSYHEKKQMGEQAREYMVKHFDIKNLAEQWGEFLFKVVKGPINPKRIKIANRFSSRFEDGMVRFDQII